MISLPAYYFFGSVAFLGVVAVILVRWTWFPSAPSSLRWLVSAFLSIFLLIAAAFTISLIGHFLFGRTNMAALTQDPTGALAYFTETGIEAMGFALFLVPLTIIYLEIKKLRKSRASLKLNVKMSRHQKWLYVAALPAGPMLFLAGFDSRDIGGTIELAFFSLIFLIFSLMTSWVINWCIDNPTLRLHESIGIQRLAIVSTINGVILFPYIIKSFVQQARSADELVLALSQSLFLAIGVSLTTWAAVNVSGWVIDGFKTGR